VPLGRGDVPRELSSSDWVFTVVCVRPRQAVTVALRSFGDERGASGARPARHHRFGRSRRDRGRPHPRPAPRSEPAAGHHRRACSRDGARRSGSDRRRVRSLPPRLEGAVRAHRPAARRHAAVPAPGRRHGVRPAALHARRRPRLRRAPAQLRGGHRRHPVGPTAVAHRPRRHAADADGGAATAPRQGALPHRAGPHPSRWRSRRSSTCPPGTSAAVRASRRSTDRAPASTGRGRTGYGADDEARIAGGWRPSTAQASSSRAYRWSSAARSTAGKPAPSVSEAMSPGARCEEKRWTKLSRAR
jgi:hypothetical protein